MTYIVAGIQRNELAMAFNQVVPKFKVNIFDMRIERAFHIHKITDFI